MYILIALILDSLLGDPHYKFHPVVIVGRIISYWEEKLYSERFGKTQGAIFLFIVLFTVSMFVLSILFTAFLLGRYVSAAAEIFLLYSALSYGALRDESKAVAVDLQNGNIEKARTDLSYIVGRDTASLDDKGIIRATIETIGENYIDGITSVLFYMLLGYFFNQAVLFAWFFKTVNTMDSMVGYKNERYNDFGKAAAILDDIMNFIPARIGALISIAAGAFAGFDAKRGLVVFLRDRKNHKSPNSAHGEAAFAGLLGITLGGGSTYNGQYVQRPIIGDYTRDVELNDIYNAHKILAASVIFSAFIVFFSVYLAK